MHQRDARLAVVAAAPVIEGHPDHAALRPVVRLRRGPGVAHRAGIRPAVDADDHRIALLLVEGRRQHPQRGQIDAIARGDGEDLGRAPRIRAGRLTARRRDLAHDGAIRAVQRQRRRSGHARAGRQEVLAVGGHADGVGAGNGGQRVHPRAVEAHAADLRVPRLAGLTGLRHHVHHAGALVDVQQAAHAPRATGQLSLARAVGGMQIQVIPPVHVAAHQQVAVGQGGQILVEADPRGLLLLDHRGDGARRRVAVQHPERVLLAIHPLDEQPLAVAGPRQPGEVVVGPRRELHPGDLAARRCHGAHLDVRVGVAGFRVTLQLEPTVLAIGPVDRKDRHRRVVEAQEGEAGAVGRPPEGAVVAAASQNLLEVHPRGVTVADGVAAVAGELPFEMRGQIVGVEVAATRVGQLTPVG